MLHTHARTHARTQAGRQITILIYSMMGFLFKHDNSELQTSRDLVRGVWEVVDAAVRVGHGDVGAVRLAAARVMEQQLPAQGGVTQHRVVLLRTAAPLLMGGGGFSRWQCWGGDTQQERTD